MISNIRIALYRLGFAYAKLNKVTEARDVLDGGGEDSRANAGHVAGFAGQGECGAREREVTMRIGSAVSRLKFIRRAMAFKARLWPRSGSAGATAVLDCSMNCLI